MKKEAIKKIIDGKKTVSFDIFDTLLFRNLYKPTDIFRIMERRVFEEYDIENFCELRINCEADSRKEENQYETSLDEIYELIGAKTGKNVDKIKDREVEIELEFIVANPFMKEIFDYAIAKCKKVVLISDMYLSSRIVTKLLNKAGYKNVPVYVSCEQHANKGSMELYATVQEKEKLDKSSWVHIGDNKQSDYEKAKEFGIEAILYENLRVKDSIPAPKTIEASIIRGIQNNAIYNGNKISYWEKFGILYASPIYYGFTNWLYRLTKDSDNMFFLARDGYIVKRVYDAFCLRDKVHVETKYLYGSRKTFQLPALMQKSKDELMNFLVVLPDDYNVKFTVEDVLKEFGLDFSKYREKLKVFGFENEKDIINKKNYYEIKKFLKYIFSDIEKELEGRREIALDYLKQEDCFKYDKINIMDVGWGGSLQEAFGILMDKDIMGYYFGTIPTNKVGIMSNSLGYVFDEARPSERYEEIFNMPMMYEFVFSAPHGTTTGFKRVKGRIEPILDNDDEIYVGIVKELQEAALNVIEKYLQYADYLKDITVEDSIFNYSEMIQRRNFEDLSEFMKLTNSVLYMDSKSKYVDEFGEDYIFSNYESFRTKIHKALWRDSYLVKGVKTQDQWLKHKEKMDNYLRRNRLATLRKRDYLIGGIRDPRRAVRFIKRKVMGH